MKKIIIIGAGVGGLASGIRLLKMGFDVEIFEKNEKVGGRMYQIEEKGFKFDVGPTIVMMPEIYNEIFEVSGVDPKDYIDMSLLSPMYDIHFKDQTKLRISTDLTQLVSQLEKIDPKDAQGYLAYLSDVYKRFLIAKEHFLMKSYSKPIQFYNPKSLYHLLRLRTLNSAYDSISSFVKDEKLRQALSFQTLYIGVSPFTGPSIYTIIPMIELLYGVWYIKGGMYEMANQMKRRFLEMGGKLRLNENVSQILIKDKVAYGVISNDEHHHSDIVLTNADFPYANSELIKEEKDKGKYTTKKIHKMSYSASSLVIYLGLDKKYKTNVHTLRFANDFKKNINDLFCFNVPEDPSFYMYSPTQVDETLSPKGKEIIYVLVPVPSLHKGMTSWSEAFQKQYVNEVLDMISQIDEFNDIKDHIEVMRVFTPDDFKKQFNLQFGATFGLRPVVTQSLYFRPQARSKTVKNLYFVGSSNHPGAGVPIVMLSADIVTREIKKDSEK